MKKTSIFLIIISFILSVLLVTSFGGAISDEQFKIRLRVAEFTTFDYTIGEEGKGQKIKMLEFSDSDLEVGYMMFTLGAHFEPEATSEKDPYSYSITDGNGEFLGNDNEMHPYAILQKSTLIIYHECVLRVMLKTIDGSAITDYLYVYALMPIAEEI